MLTVECDKINCIVCIVVSEVTRSSLRGCKINLESEINFPGEHTHYGMLESPTLQENPVFNS